MSKSNHYVDNEEFLNELLKYEKARNDSDNPDLVQPSPFVSHAILKICNKLLESPVFMKQNVDKDSLISEAVFDCVKALKNFDSNKSKNPFAYYTQIAYYAFLKTLIKEQNLFKKKCKMIQSNAFDCLDIVSELDGHGVSNDPNIENTVSQLKVYLDYNLNGDEEKKAEKKKSPRAPLYLQKQRAAKAKKAEEEKNNPSPKDEGPEPKKSIKDIFNDT